MTVPTYQMTVTDDATNTVSTYEVTRDAPIVDPNEPGDKNDMNVNNTAFEPKADMGKYSGIAVNDYPNNTGFTAVVLTNKDGSRKLDAEPMKGALRTDPNKAKGVSIHVGGTYTNLQGQGHITGSEGCFSIKGGNDAIKKFGSDLKNRIKASKKAGKGDGINVNVQKRKNVKKNYSIGA